MVQSLILSEWVREGLESVDSYLGIFERHVPVYHIYRSTHLPLDVQIWYMCVSRSLYACVIIFQNVFIFLQSETYIKSKPQTNNSNNNIIQKTQIFIQTNDAPDF